MTDVITKVAIGGVEYPFAGGGSSGEEHEFITQEEYEQLTPAQKAEKVYMITGEGETPTPGGGTAVERGDMLLNKVVLACDVDGYNLSGDGTGASYTITLRNNYGLIFNTIQSQSGGAYRYIGPTYHGYLIYYLGFSSTNGKLYSYDINNSQLYQYGVLGDAPGEKPKLFGEHVYIYFRTQGYKRFNLDLTGETDITQEEYDNVADFWGSYNGLFYTQDGKDYVASDIEGTEVKRYVGVGTIHGIADGKLYRNVGDVAYAIATI